MATSDLFVVCGSPRSGTTWLAELLSAMPRSAILFEPLHLDQVPEARIACNSWRPFIEADSDCPELYEFIGEVYSGRLLNDWLLSQTTVSASLKAQKWIVKFVRANRLLPWLTTNFAKPRYMLVHRHPCAVIASQLRADAWHSPAIELGSALETHFPQFVNYWRSLTDPVEILAAQWAIDLLVPMTASRQNWLTVQYENLVKQGEKEIDRMVSAWNLSHLKSKFAGKLMKASSTAFGVKNINRAAQLNKWKTQLESSQIAAIERVVTEIGFNISDDQYFAWSGRVSEKELS